MNRSDVDAAVKEAHLQIINYLMGMKGKEALSVERIGAVVDDAFATVRQKLDAASGVAVVRRPDR